MKIINLTKHAINIYNQDKSFNLTVEPSGQEARIETTKELVGISNGVPFFETKVTGKPLGLPEPEEGTIFIVSGIFRLSYDRKDLWQPGELLRDEKGQPIGCVGLSR